ASATYCPTTAATATAAADLASADFVYGSSFPKPRFAQGAVPHALASVYARLVAPLYGLPPDPRLLPARTYDKPLLAALDLPTTRCAAVAPHPVPGAMLLQAPLPLL
ncbi:hypothetical protein HK405_001802, partial [Cladochytrium tenue]